MKKKLKVGHLVKFDFDKMLKEYHLDFPFSKYNKFIFLGEIVQMPGHGIFVDIRTGQVHCAYHMDEFRILSDEEC